MKADWRRITAVRDGAQKLLKALEESPEVVRMLQEEFGPDWPKFTREIGYVAGHNPGAPLMALDAVRAKTGTTPTAIYELVEEGKFPAPVFYKPEPLWLESDVNAWRPARNAH